MNQGNMSDVILRTRGLSKHYVQKDSLFAAKNKILAVRDVDLEVRRGETLGLVGESGCGKSTLARMILRLTEPNSGSIEFLGRPIDRLTQAGMRTVRRDLQIVFQSGSTVLDPRRTIGELLEEALAIHRTVAASGRESEVIRLLDSVGLAAADRMKTIGKMSGGQVQRVLIARAISVRPRMIVCDEPVSALDVSVQGQILNLLLELKEKLDITYLFISHDMKVIRHICDRVAVMEEGRIIRSGPVEEILA